MQPNTVSPISPIRGHLAVYCSDPTTIQTSRTGASNVHHHPLAGVLQWLITRSAYIYRGVAFFSTFKFGGKVVVARDGCALY